MNLSPQDDPHAPSSAEPLRLRCFGVGGAGVRIVEALAHSGLPSAACIAANTDGQSLATSGLERRLQLGVRLTRGLGAGGDPETGRAAAGEARGEIEAACQGAGLVFVITGLGGGTGTGAAPEIARIARDSGALTVAVATLPFECEGARRRRQAEAGLEHLRAAADVLLCLPHQRVVRALDENTSLIETFRFTDALIAQGVCGIWHMLTEPGMIQVDFADLRRALMGRHVQGAFASVDASGEHRVREAIEKLAASPLFEGGALLAEAETVLVNLRAGLDLAVGEIQRVTDQIQRRCEGAHLVVGAAVDAALGDRLSVTLIAAHRAASAATPPEPASRSSGHSGELMGSESSMFRPTQPEPARGRGPDIAPVGGPAEARGGGSPSKASVRNRARMEQAMLPLEMASKGRFEKSEPTLYRGQDLDVPTYIRRGVVLN